MSDAVVGRTETAEALARHAARCGTTPARLRRALRGDLDTIVAKALKKSPAERYASVTALADDLRRFLRHEPIGARPDTLRYRAARFVRRHAARRRGGGGGRPADRRPDGVLHDPARDRARPRAAGGREGGQGERGADRTADRRRSDRQPRDAGRTDGPRAARCSAPSGCRRSSPDQPEAQAEILTVIGRMYRRLGMYDKAQQLLEQALASGRAAFGPSTPAWRRRSTISARVAAEKGDYQAAAASLESALSMRREIYRRGAHGRRRHAGRARPHLPGSGAQRAGRAAAARGAGDPAEACSATSTGRPPSA